MADKDLSGRPAATSVADADNIYGVQGGNTRRFPYSVIRGQVGADNFGPTHDMPDLGYSADFYLGPGLVATTSTAVSIAPIANQLRAQKVIIPYPRTYTEICAHCGSAAAGSNIGLALYSPGADGLPGALITGSGDISCAATGKKTFAFSEAFRGGQSVWMVIWNDGEATKNITGFAETQFLSQTGIRINASGISISSSFLYRNLTFDTANWPDPFGATVPNGDVAYTQQFVIGIR